MVNVKKVEQIPHINNFIKVSVGSLSKSNLYIIAPNAITGAMDKTNNIIDNDFFMKENNIAKRDSIITNFSLIYL